MATKTQRSKTGPGTVEAPVPVEIKALDSIRDLTTKKGTCRIIQLSVEQYLKQLKVWDGTTVGNLETDAKYQRGILDINTNKIKQKMFYDLIRGGTLPPLIVHDKGNSWDIIDGQQRSHVITEVLKTIRIVELGETQIKKFANEKLEKMEKNGETYLTSDDFLARPIVVQVWTDLDEAEAAELFMLLNHSQQRVSNRHLLEIGQAELEQIFVNWGLPVTTQRNEKEHPGHRGKPPKGEVRAAKAHAFRLEYLINGAIAYTASPPDPHTKTTGILHEDDIVLNQSLTTITSKHCEHDFKWVCIVLLEIMLSKYGKSKSNVLLSDSFFVATMAALSWARQDSTIAMSVESRQTELIDLLNSSETTDPMVLEDGPRGLNNITITAKASIGKKKRNMVYMAWKQFLINGVRDTSYPINWQEGKKLS